MGLFELKDFIMHSGEVGEWKIECDALTDEDWETVAYWISERFDFNHVVGVPTGAELLQNKLLKKSNPRSKTILIVDDVLTTGGSMEDTKRTLNTPKDYEVKGVVLFARSECPDWVTPIFKMW